MDHEIQEQLVELEGAIQEVINQSRIKDIVKKLKSDGWNINIHMMVSALKNEFGLNEDDHDFLKECGIKW